MNTNPNAKRILCFGDSLTWGYVPGTDHDRYPSNVRWTGVLQDSLGANYEVIEEGLNSRGINHGDNRPGKEGRNAMDYILPCIDTHMPLDLMVILLGTNGLKSENNLEPNEIAASLASLLDIIDTRVSRNKVLVLSPPLVNETTEYAEKEKKYFGGHIKSKDLYKEYLKIANEKKLAVISLADMEVGTDGVHLTEKSHLQVGKLLADKIKDFFSE